MKAKEIAKKTWDAVKAVFKGIGGGIAAFCGAVNAAVRKASGWVWALVALVVVFSTVGLSTLGSTAESGKSATLLQGKQMIFNLSQSGEKLDSIYIKVGEIYTAPGADTTITVKTSTSSSSSTSWNVVGSEIKMGNLYSETAGSVSGANHNWYCVADGMGKSGIYRVSVLSSVNMELDEIVCLSESGKKITLSAYTNTTNPQAYSAAEVAPAIDAQDSFTKSKSVYHTLTQEEGYYMSAVQNVLSGSEVMENSIYTLDRDYNFLATALMACSVAIFGESVFALRLPAFVATVVLIVFAYLLIRQFTKSEKYGFIAALLLSVGGMLTTVGRMGAPHMFIVSALVASLYFMHRFFAKGILTGHVIKGGLNVLFSGVFAALALAMDATAVLPIIGILVLFGFGMRRQKLAYKVALEKTVGQEETVVTEAGETVVINKAERKAKAAYAHKNRVCYGFVGLAIALEIIFLLIGAVVCQAAFVRTYNAQDAGFLEVLVRGIRSSIRSTNMTSFAAANECNVLAWFLPIKAATVYGGAGAGDYLAWNVLPNIVLTTVCFIAFVATTVKVAKGFVEKDADKTALRVRRAYFILLGGMAAAMLAAIVRGMVSVESSVLFSVLYIGFIPLAAMAFANGKAKKALNVTLWAVVALSVVAFVMMLPGMYGFSVSSGFSKCFTWMSISGNKYFR